MGVFFRFVDCSDVFTNFDENEGMRNLRIEG